MLKAIVSEFNKPYLAEAVRIPGVHVVYWIGSTEFPGAICHRTTDAKFGIPPKGEWFKHAAVPYFVWKQLEAYQPMLFEMMEGLCLPYADRLSLYRILVRYWFAVLEQIKPAFYLMPVSPHGVYDYLLYALCQVLGVKTAVFRYTSLPDTIYLADTFETPPVWELTDKAPSKKMTDYLARVRGDYSAGIPPITEVRLKDEPSKPSLLYSAAHLIRMMFKKARSENERIRNRATIRQHTRAIVSPRRKSALEKYYRSLARPADFGLPYIYVALHSQPERSTMPDGDVWRDQLAMIDWLAHQKRTSLYVKEHPGHFSLKNADLSRSREYYRYIASFPNIQLLPIETNTFDLIDHSQAVATVTGTVGWEALVRKKYAYVFGPAWYKQFVGGGITVEQFVASVEAGCINGYTTDVHERVSDLTPEENINNLRNGISQWIRKNFSNQ